MDNLAAVITIILGLATLTALVGSTYVLFRASLSRARINALREDNQDLRNRVDDQDKELIKCQAREKVLEETCVHLREENDMLKKLVLQRAEVDGVKAEVERLFEELASHHIATIDVLQGIKEALVP